MPYASPDTMYVMDSSFELLEMTPDVYEATSFSHIKLDNYFDTYDAHYTREGACPAIKNLCTMMHQWIEQQDPVMKGIVLHSNLYDAGLQLVELTGSVSNRLIIDHLSTKGIKEEPFFGFNYNPRVYEDEPLNIHSESDLLFPANIASVITNNTRVYDYVKVLKSRLKKTFECDVGFDDMHKRFLKEVDSHTKRTSYNPENMFSISKTDQQKQIYSARKVIKKGIKKFTNLFGNKDISTFISGEGFIVEGERFNWAFRQKSSNSLIKMTHSPLQGHIPYSLMVMSKSNVVLADCCVYVTGNTPIIDQVITIMLYIRHDEDGLLDSMNLFNKRPAFYENFELFPEKFHPRDSERSMIDLPIEKSLYEVEFTRLRKLYAEKIHAIVPSIIGIDPQLFKFMVHVNGNPIRLGEKEKDFRLAVTEQNLLIG